jgi:NTE family protein
VIPLFVVAADLGSGAEVVIDRGLIADALRASMSIPGALEPRPWDGRFLVDGGVVSPLPSRVLRDAGFRWVIGSNVAGQDPEPTRAARPPSIVETMTRMSSMREREVLSDQVALLDVEIRPVVKASNSFDFSGADRFVDEGVRAAREQLPAVERLLEAAGR